MNAVLVLGLLLSLLSFNLTGTAQAQDESPTEVPASETETSLPATETSLPATETSAPVDTETPVPTDEPTITETPSPAAETSTETPTAEGSAEGTETATADGSETAVGTMTETVTETVMETPTLTLTVSPTALLLDLSIIPARISAGESHTCGVTRGGGVKCWGKNDAGQLGNNSTSDSLIPVAVEGLVSGVAAVSAGGGHTCALTGAGGVKCWGNNDDSELGNNSTIDSAIPVDVDGLGSGVVALSAGNGFTCALLNTGSVKCWGRNNDGQSGNNSTASSTVPVDVAGLESGVTALSTGYEHACALTSGGGVKCWGRNTNGQLGNNSTTDSLTVVDVTGLESGVTAVSAGNGFTCALTSGGGVKCWGWNNLGQLGNNSTTDSPTAVDVEGLTSGMPALNAGGQHACALTSAGGVKCWGENTAGQLGNNSTANSLTAVDVEGLSSGVAAMDGGTQHTCALMVGGAVKCWGKNDAGQLGNNSTKDSLKPVDVAGIDSVLSSAVITLKPSARIAGNSGFTLLVNGTGFVDGCVVRWNGADRVTTFISETQLSAVIDAADVAVEGAASVTVYTPSESVAEFELFSSNRKR